MKRLFVFMAAALMLVACKDEDPLYIEYPAPITIVKSSVIFDAPGGTGSIQFEANGLVKVTSASDWCKVSVSGNEVTVTADENLSLDGRASRITLECGGESVYVVSQQKGMEYSFTDAMYLVEMDGGVVNITGMSSFPVEYSTEADWIHVTRTDDGFTLNIGENDSKGARTGTFILTSGSIETVYTIKQKFERNFEGTYVLDYYTSTSKATAKKLSVTIRRDEEDLDLYYISGITASTTYSYEIPIRYDPATEMLSIKNTTYLGEYGEGLWEYVIVNYSTSDLATGYVSYSSSASYDIYFTYRYSNKKYTFELYDSAPMFNKARRSTGFSLYTFTVDKGNTLSSSNRKGSVLGLIFPTFTQQ